MLKNKAVQNELTSKPPTITSHSKITIALITKRNNPSVIMVTGKVNKTKIGFTTRFRSPSTIATNTAVPNPATEIPGIKYATSITKSAVTTIRRIKFII